jgi:hypothetical protein
MGLGGENDEDTAKRIAAYEAKHGPITDEQIAGGLAAVLEQDAFNHRTSRPPTAAAPTACP